jgi:hypothetical protein
LRHAFAPKPESKLMVEAICQGVVDHISVDDFDRGRSIRFRKGHNLEGIGDLIGLYLVGGWESDVCGKPDGLFLVGDDRPGVWPVDSKECAGIQGLNSWSLVTK